MNLVEQRFWKAVDADPQRRPGVPAERPPAPMGNAHWLEPEMQPPRPEVLKDAQRAGLTATFGTGQPPHGLSGVIRREAYRIPDYDARRWLLLMLADRIDWMEERAGHLVRHPAVWTAAALTVGGLLAVTQARARRWPRFSFLRSFGRR